MKNKYALGYLLISICFLLAAGIVAISGGITLYDYKFGRNITYEGAGLALLVLSLIFFCLCSWLAYRKARMKLVPLKENYGVLLSGMAGLIALLAAWAHAGGIFIASFV